VLTGASLSVAGAPATERRVLEPDDDPLGFAEDIAPLLESRCAGCHGGPNAEGDFAIDGADPYADLTAPHDPEGWAWVDAAAGLARRSCLVEPLIGRELDCPRPLAAHPATALTSEELGRITLWIDLGASPSWR